MKRKYIFLPILIIVLLCIIPTKKAYQLYSISTELPIYPCQQHHDDTLRIIIVGDSWAFMHQPYDDSLANLIHEQTGKPTRVTSYGICGVTSKGFYQHVHTDDSLRLFLQNGADYCFISLGINDTYHKTGAHNYACHTIYLLRFLLQNNIKPILMEIPDYDIIYTYDHQTVARKILRKFSMAVTNSQKDCRKDYRDMLAKELSTSNIISHVTLFPVIKYDSTLFASDRMHLNEKGYARLDSTLAYHFRLNNL